MDLVTQKHFILLSFEYTSTISNTQVLEIGLYNLGSVYWFRYYSISIVWIESLVITFIAD